MQMRVHDNITATDQTLTLDARVVGEEGFLGATKGDFRSGPAQPLERHEEAPRL